jgi:DNA-binding transcriptional ArsR family regulator
MYADLHVENSNEILLIVTHYESVDAVRQTLSDHGIHTKLHEENGALVILDGRDGYQGGDVNDVLKLAKSLVERANEEGRKGLCVFGDMGSFFLLDRITELIEYELSIPPKLGIRLKGFCCYSVEDYNNLSQMQKLALEHNHHNQITPQDLRHLIQDSRGSLTRSRILDLICSHPANAHQIASKLGLNYKTATHHLRIMRACGLVMVSNERRYGATFFVTPIMKNNIALLNGTLNVTKIDSSSG